MDFPRVTKWTSRAAISSCSALIPRMRIGQASRRCRAGSISTCGCRTGFCGVGQLSFPLLSRKSAFQLFKYSCDFPRLQRGSSSCNEEALHLSKRCVHGWARIVCGRHACCAWRLGSYDPVLRQICCNRCFLDGAAVAPISKLMESVGSAVVCMFILFPLWMRE